MCRENYNLIYILSLTGRKELHTASAMTTSCEHTALRKVQWSGSVREWEGCSLSSPTLVFYTLNI